MINVKEIAFTGYPVTDMTRARAFYEGVLRLKLAATFEHAGRHWIEYEVGGATLAVSNMSADMWKPSSDGPVVALEMTDFEAAVETLRSAGVKFLLGPMDTGVCKMLIVADPDGNSLVIHKRHAG
jgi:predicted enzyme related to lactoylglutathione lyase